MLLSWHRLLYVLRGILSLELSGSNAAAAAHPQSANLTKGVTEARRHLVDWAISSSGGRAGLEAVRQPIGRGRETRVERGAPDAGAPAKLDTSQQSQRK